MPYFNIAYLREEFDDCVCILNQADSVEAARAAFQARNPHIKIVDVWERKGYVPARSDGPLPTEVGRIEALEKRVAELERKLQDGHRTVIKPLNNDLESDVLLINMARMNENAKIYAINGEFRVSRNGLKINGKYYIFNSFLIWTGAKVKVINGEVYARDNICCGMLRYA